jgi:glycosyltransferase involved in cell wall biosynthesis
MSHPPLVSVLVPAYNEALFIGPTIESVLCQTYANYELIVVDNASTDSTRDVVRRFRDRRVRLVGEVEHVGPGRNFNRALALAQGEFIKLLPADDIIYPSCLEKQAALLCDPAYADVALVSCARDVIDEKGAMVRRANPQMRGRVPGIEAVRRTIRAGANIIGEPAVGMMRRSTVDAVGGINDALPFMFDMDFWCRVLLQGDLYAIPETLAAFRVSRKSLSYQLLGRQSRQFHSFIDQMRQNPAYSLGRWDGTCGKINALIREVVRWGAYTYILWRY